MIRLSPALVARSHVILRFLTAQSLTTALFMLYGLLCVRLLSPADYAKYVVVNGIMGALLVLMDSNFTGTLIPLVGTRVDDKQLIANYVAALRRLSIWAYLVVGVGLIFCFPYLVHNRNWDRPTVAGMILCILTCTWFARLAGNYFPVLMMARDRDTWYKAQLIGSFGGIVLLLLAWGLHWLGAFQAIVINIIGYAYMGFLGYFRSRQLLGRKGVPEPEKQKAIIRLALPNLPQAIFFAVQGQLSLFLITYFGHTKAVASVGALGRLGQIFAIFLTANSLLVEPYFAKLPKEKLKAHYAIALMIGAAISISILLIAIRVPELLLWALGPQYSGLQVEVKLAVGASAISCFSALLWGIHSARRFVYWWNVMFGIIITLITQIVFIVKTDISTVRGVLLLNLATTAASLLVNVTAGVYGFINGPREGEQPVKITEGEAEAEAMIELAEAKSTNISSLPQMRITQPEIVDSET